MRKLRVDVFPAVLSAAIGVVAAAALAVPSAAFGVALPVIESESVSHVTQTSARLEAQVNPSGGWDHTQFQLVKNPGEYMAGFACPVEWGDSSLCIGTEGEGGLPMRGVSGGVPESVRVEVALQPDTTYHYRIIAAQVVQKVDTFGYEPPIVYGPDQTFTTLPTGGEPEAPTTELCPGQPEAYGAMKLCGRLNPGSRGTTGYYFAYGGGTTSCKEGDETPLQPDAEVQNEGVSAEATGLEGDSQYTYCLVATSPHGETYGSPVTFTSTPGPPVVRSVYVNISPDGSVTIDGWVYPAGLESEYEVWLQEADCQNAQPAAQCQPVSQRRLVYGTAPAGNESKFVQAEPGSWRAGYSYTYWVVAANKAGRSESRHQTWNSPRVIDSESVSAVTEHDATLEAQISPEQYETAYRFEIAKTPSCLPGSPFPPGNAAETALLCLQEEGALPTGLLHKGLYGEQHVSLDLAGAGVVLEAGATYTFRVVATREQQAPVVGAAQMFSTPSQPAAQTCTNSAASTGCAASNRRKGPRPLTRAQKLARALKVCKKDKKKAKRATCKKRARKQFGAKPKKPRRR
jgi:hypothetical protein